MAEILKQEWTYLKCLNEMPSASENWSTVKILNIRTPKTFAVITLKSEQDGFTREYR